MNLQEELKALKQRIAELEGLAKDEQGFPQNGDNYWYINPLGIVLRDEWLDFVSERYMIEIGNVFKTEQDAHFAVEKLKVEAELRKFSRPFIEGEDNWYMALGDAFETYYMNDSIDPIQGVIYFDSLKRAHQATGEIGAERIKKYIFEVEGTNHETSSY